MQDITFKEIQSLEDIGDIFEVASRYDIPLDGCESCEDFVERITLHKQKLEGHHKHLLDEHRYENLKIEDHQKRQAICNIFKSVQTNLDGNFQLLTRVLESRGISKDLESDISDHLNSLQNGECNIVIAGQTSAGKSTLLNLLLGMDILPKHCLSCTSSICKLRYDTKFKVKVTHGKEVSERVLKTKEDTTAYLDDLIAEKEYSRRARGDTIPEVEIFLPADLLKCGVTVVDTPGFGESDNMDNLVKDFVTKGRVAAFVYVIKTDSAGGVQEDRLVRFLKTFLENNKRREGENNKGQDQQTFNPRAALFVCNRWDQIADSEKPEVKASVLEKLKDVWPRLEDNQVCFFSTIRAQASRDVDKEYITTDLHQLLHSLNGLFVLAQQDTITMSYGWLKSVMKECTIYLKAILSQLALEDREQEQKFGNTRQNLDALQTRADDIIEKLKRKLEQASNTMVIRFKQILSSKAFREQVSEWNINEIPPIPGTQKEMEEYKETLDGMIVNKIFRLFDNMDDCRTFVSDLRSDMLCEIKGSLRLLDEDMQDIMADLGGSFRSSGSSNKSGGSEDEETIVAELKNKRDAKSFTQRVRNYTLTRSRPGGLSPRAFVCRTIAPIVCKAIAPIVDRMAQQKYQQTRRASQGSPKHVIAGRTEKVLIAVTEDEDLIRRFVSRYTDRLDQQINSIRLNIPSFIEANQTLMKEIKDCRKEARRHREELKLAMECLEPQKEMLRGFGYLHVKDFSSDDILFHMDDLSIKSSTMCRVDMFLHSSQSDVGSRRAVQGLWAVVQKAELTIDEKKVPVMVKCYSNQPENQHLFKEIAKLRCLEHPSIATFLGMTHNETQSSFVFNDHLTSARRYLRRQTTKVREAVPSILMKLVEGLETIHRDDLVHMELSLDTVMVNDVGEVKLCNMCLPRKCRFPSDTEVIEVGDFICLSPKVLRGGMYSRDADVYSFGIIVFELLMPRKPYEEQRTWKLSRFMNEVHPAFMLKLGEQDISQVLSDLLRGCLLPGQGLRLPLVRIKEMLRALNDDSNTLHCRNLKEKIRRSSSLAESVRKIPLQHSLRSVSNDSAVLTLNDNKEEFV